MKTLLTAKQYPELELYQDLNQWYQSPLGMHLQFKIQLQIAEILNKPPIYSVIQVGIPAFSDLLSGQKIPAHCQVAIEECLGEKHLPYYANSQDCMVLVHGLDISHQPHHILREMDRVLTDSGYLLIVGFNRLSVWGLIQGVTRWRKSAPWRCRFYTINTLRDWLSLLNYDVYCEKSVDYMLPMLHRGAMNRVSLFERIASALFPRAGNIYILAAKKRTLPLTPMKAKWQTHTLMPVNFKPSPETTTAKMQL